MIKPQLIIERCPGTGVTNPSRQLVVKGKSEFTDHIFVNGGLVLKEKTTLTATQNINRSNGIAFCIANGNNSTNIDLRNVGDTQGFPKGSILILYGNWSRNTPSSDIILSNPYEQHGDISIDSTIKITIGGENIGRIFMRVEDVGSKSSWVVLNKI